MRISHRSRTESFFGGGVVEQATVLFKNVDEEAKFLRKMADVYAKNEAIRELALKTIFPACAARDEHAQALALGEWVQRNITYVHEAGEVFQRPTVTLKQKAGDCDSTTTLLCALLGSVGIKNAMCLMQIEGKWAHIFPVALCRTKDGIHRLTLDTTLTSPVADLVNPIARVRASGRRVTKVKFA
jgi:hypothetical protein